MHFQMTHRFTTSLTFVLILFWCLEPAQAQNTPLELHFVGDVSFAGRRLYPKSQIRSEKNPFRYMKEVFSRADLVVANGEGLLTEAPPEAYGHSRLNIAAEPRWSVAYRRAGIDLVGLANNHTWDGGAPGLLENRRHLLKSGVRVYGAGFTAAEATKAYRMNAGTQCRVAIVPATLKSNRPARRGAYAAYYRGKKGRARLASRIQGLAAEGCFVIVSVHWGKEGVHKPPSHVVRAAHRMVDAGADLVVGHHPHVLQGVEYYKGKPIAYSLGNFVFTNRTPAKRETGVLSVQLTRTGPTRLTKLALLPATIAIRGGFVPKPSTDKQRRETADHLREWSEPFGTQVELRDEGIIFSPGG